MKKKATSVILCLLVLASAFLLSFSAGADFNTEEIVSELVNDHYYMLNLDTNTVVFSKNAKEQVVPAAMIKVLAAVYACENWGTLEEKITVTDEDMALVPDYSSIRKVGFSSGDSYTKLELIQAMLIYSANDAEAVIAKRMSGSNDEFVKALNAFAKEIGCKNTNVVSAYGFDEDGQYTTARDVAMIFKRGMKSAGFSDSIQLSSMTLPASEHTSEKKYSTSAMMTYAASPYYHASVKGGKETFTRTSGKCTGVISVQDGYSYITIVMNGKDASGSSTNTANADAQKMIAWVYKNLSIKTIAEAGAVVATLPVQGGKRSDNVKLTVKKTVSALVSNNVSSSSVLVALEEGAENMKLTAPVKEGDPICKADIIYANETIATVDLVAASTVSLSPGRLFLQKLSNFMMSNFMIFLEVVSLIVLSVLLAYYILKILKANGAVNLVAIRKDSKDIPPEKNKVKKNPFDKLAESAKTAADKVKGADIKSKITNSKIATKFNKKGH